MGNKKVFIFTSVHRWDDTRIFYKQAKSLSKEFTVELHAPADFQYKNIDRVSIFGLPKWENVSDRKNIRKEIWKRIKKSDSHIYHFHDPELLWIGIKIRLLKKKPVIYDIHEDYERSILTKNWIPNYLKVILSKLFYIFEKISVMFIHNVINTTNLIANKFNSNSINQIVIYNYPFIPQKDINLNLKNENLIVYVGGISKIRGIFEIIQAIALVAKDQSIKLIVIGPIQNDELENEILEAISNYGVEKNIKLMGFVPYSEIFNYIEKAIVGLLCYLPVPNHLVTIPNKIFEYTASGTAVIASDFPLYREIIDDANSGILVNPTNPTDISNAIIEVLNNPGRFKQMGQNGYSAIMEKFNWETQEKKLIKFYKTLLLNKI